MTLKEKASTLKERNYDTTPRTYKKYASSYLNRSSYIICGMEGDVKQRKMRGNGNASHQKKRTKIGKLQKNLYTKKRRG